MSYHRENVIWQSADGTWSRAFYTANTHDAYDDEDYDPEWDVDYDWSSFQWVSTGHRTKEAAEDSWVGSNPGGHSEVVGGEDADKLDDIAAQAQNGSAIYHGPSKQRLIRFIARDLVGAQITAHSYKLGGYANLPDGRIDGWSKELDMRMRTASDAERKQVRDVMHAAGRRLTQMADKTAEQQRNTWNRAFLPGAIEATRKQSDTFARYRGPQKTVAGQAAASRRKTTAKSTAGSFASRGFAEPEVTL